MKDTKGIVWLKFCILNPVQTDAALLANNYKLCWIKNVTYCVRLHTLSCCCVLLGVVAQSLKPLVKLLAPCKGRNIVGQQLPTLLGVVASVFTYNCSFKCKDWVFYRTDFCQGQFTLLIRSRVSWNKSQLSSLIIFLALQTLKKKIKRDFLKEKTKHDHFS